MMHLFFPPSRHRAAILLPFFALLFVVACKKDIELPIDPDTDKNELSEALLLKGSRKKGEAPSSTGSGAGIFNHVPTASVTPDNIVFIPFVHSAGSAIRGVYLQVVGADSYWDVPVPADPNNIGIVALGLPDNVIDGVFEVQYAVYDQSGNIGQPVLMNITVNLPVVFCEQNISSFDWVEGNDGITNVTYELGDTPGWVTIEFDTYTVPDRLDLRYGSQWIRSTGDLLDNADPRPPLKPCDQVVAGDGFLGQHNYFTFYYDPNVSRKVSIYVSGCMDGGTRWQFRIVDCPKDLPLIGVHTSVSSNWAVVNIWNHGHAWITITEHGKTTRYGLWPDWNDDIEAAGLDNGSGTDVRKNFEQGTGLYSRFMYVTPDKLAEVNSFISKHWEYSLPDRNCATFAQKTWYVATGEELAANEFWNGSPVESPRKLGYSIEAKEYWSPTVHLRPTDVPQVTNPLSSFD